MDAQAIQWIFGSLITVLCLVIGYLFTAHGKTQDKVHDTSERVRALETVFELFGKNLMKAMHRIDDCHGADKILDEYVRRDGELTIKQWIELRQIYQRVIDEGDSGHSRGELVGAAMVVAFCDHKLRGIK